MKTNLLPIRFITVAFTLPVLLMGSCAAQSLPSPDKVGIYNSRAVALAYGRSKQHNESVSKLVADAYKAKNAGDKETFSKLQKDIEARQDRLHQQVFGDVRIDDVMKVMEPSLAALKKNAGVDRIVDKRDAPSGVRTVDVTRQLVDYFQPTDKTLEMIDETLKHPPLKDFPKH